jgi:hypothetical protein
LAELKTTEEVIDGPRGPDLGFCQGHHVKMPHPRVLCKGGHLGPIHLMREPSFPLADLQWVTRGPRGQWLFRIASLFCSCWCYFAVQTVALVIGASREKQFCGRSISCAVATKAESPEPVDRERRTVCIQERTFLHAGHEVEGVDFAVAEIANQQAMTEGAKVTRREGYPLGLSPTEHSEMVRVPGEAEGFHQNRKRQRSQTR